jgi:hypothetical protein
MLINIMNAETLYFTHRQIPAVIDVNVNYSWEWLEGAYYGYRFGLVSEMEVEKKKKKVWLIYFWSN